MINYLKEKLRPIVGGMLVLVFINIYFLYLCGSRLYLSDLVYLDVILIFIGITIFIYGNVKYRAVEKIMKTNIFFKTKQLIPEESSFFRLPDHKSRLSGDK